MSNFEFKPSHCVLANQRAVILDHLKEHGQINTIEAREERGIQGIAPRILELRRSGHIIDTQRAVVTDTMGRSHSVANYIYRGVAK